MQLEPKNNNGFAVEFPEEFRIESFAVQKINKPKFSNDEWENIKIEFIDVVEPSTSAGLYLIVEFLQKNVSNDSKILFDIKIQSTDPVGSPVEEWVVSVAEVITIDFGDLDYDSKDIQRPYMIVKPFRCVLK